MELQMNEQIQASSQSSLDLLPPPPPIPTTNPSLSCAYEEDENVFIPSQDLILNRENDIASNSTEDFGNSDLQELGPPESLFEANFEDYIDSATVATSGQRIVDNLLCCQRRRTEDLPPSYEDALNFPVAHFSTSGVGVDIERGPRDGRTDTNNFAVSNKMILFFVITGLFSGIYFCVQDIFRIATLTYDKAILWGLTLTCNGILVSAYARFYLKKEKLCRAFCLFAISIFSFSLVFTFEVIFLETIF